MKGCTCNHKRRGEHRIDGTCPVVDCYCVMPVSVQAKPDVVNHPEHYTSSEAKCSACGHPIECIDVVRHHGFALGNAIKYLWRAGLKGALLEDLKKARWYITDAIKQLGGE